MIPSLARHAIFASLMAGQWHFFRILGNCLISKPVKLFCPNNHPAIGGVALPKFEKRRIVYTETI
jgi:hypothetical protein